MRFTRRLYTRSATAVAAIDSVMRLCMNVLRLGPWGFNMCSVMAIMG